MDLIWNLALQPSPIKMLYYVDKPFGKLLLCEPGSSKRKGGTQKAGTTNTRKHVILGKKAKHYRNSTLFNVKLHIFWLPTSLSTYLPTVLLSNLFWIRPETHHFVRPNHSSYGHLKTSKVTYKVCTTKRFVSLKVWLSVNGP